MRTTILGFFIALAIFYFGIIGSISNRNLLVDINGLIIVLGGTLSVGIITFGLGNMIAILTNAVKIFIRPKLKIPDIINELKEISNYLNNGGSMIGISKRFDGLHPFIKDGLRLIENNLSEEEILEILSEDLEQRKSDQLSKIEVIRTLSKYPPAFGMMGTVVGLIGLLGSLNKGNGDIIGASMAVALLTTLYGLLLSNYFFTPVSDNLMHRLSSDYNGRQIIIKGILLLRKKTDPLLMNEFLKIHLRPGKRNQTEVAA